jgi:dipeptide transport system substrate-binding protein
MSWAGDNGDPDNFLSTNLTCAALNGGGNKSQWCDKPFDELVDTARKTTDLRKRTELYVKAQKRIYDEVPAIPTVYPVNMTAINKRVEGYVPNPFTHNDFRSVSVK